MAAKTQDESKSKITPNTTQTPNLYIDQYMAFLTGEEWKCLCYTVRRTMGFHKLSDQISLAQYAHGLRTKDGKQLDYGTGLSKATAGKAVASLVAFGLLIQVKPPRGNDGGVYALQLDDAQINQDAIMNRASETFQKSKARTNKGRAIWDDMRAVSPTNRSQSDKPQSVGQNGSGQSDKPRAFSPTDTQKKDSGKPELERKDSAKPANAVSRTPQSSPSNDDNTATERLSTTIQEKAVTPDTTQGETPKEKSFAKKEKVELSEALTFSSRFQEVGPGDYITHAIASTDTMERTVCGKPVEELLIIKELPYAHTLHACEKCQAVVEGVRATGGGQLPTAPLVKAAKKPKTPKPESDLPPLTNEAKDALALECYGTVTAWNYAPNASAMGKALRDCKNPTAEQIKAHQRWWNVNDFRGRKGQRPRPHQVAETWAEALQELSNGNGRLLGNRAESRIRYDDYPE
ncbi:MAG: replication protein [Bryobacterales bacterium]|nr:replication protein [Bryobacterales bacterium]